MNIELTTLPVNEVEADIELILVIDNNFNHPFVKDKKALKRAGFSGAQDEVCHLPEKRRIYAGSEDLSSGNLRSAVATAMRALHGKKYKTLKIASYLNKGCTFSLRAIVEGLELGNYTFDKYKSEKTKKIKHVYLSTQEYGGTEIGVESAAKQIHKGQIVADATNFTRDIVNTPPDDCYPAVMAKIAKKLAKHDNIECTVLKPKAIEKERMGALLAVARASRHEPRVIHLAYKPENPKAVVSLVGKGLTYDSGGLSLKPSDFMVTMKADKSGASAVLGIVRAAAELELPVEVHGFIGAVENMIGGDAYKPDDVLTTKSGKTVEVRNTDAEGRLVLADVLTYAQQEVEADYLFDFATLTGACVVGLGNYTTGVMGFNEKLKSEIVREAEYAGEYATALTFNRHLKKTLKSSVADISNISNTRYGGALTAGLFLSEFIEEENRHKWVHHDIAGPAYVEHAWAENPVGASGAGVRMTIKWMEKLVHQPHKKSDR
jgi:leucyl aminopeptidase